MLKNILVDLEAVENLIFFWSMIEDREKVSEIYILTVAEMKQYQAIYNEEFDNISVRKVLSAISNREVFRGDNKRESRFWVDNLWMLEDLNYTMNMVAPIKVLHVKDLVEKVNESGVISPYETLKVVFVPFYHKDYIIIKDSLYINFFKALPDKNSLTKELIIGGKPIKEFIEEKLVELIENDGKEETRIDYSNKLRNVFY